MEQGRLDHAQVSFEAAVRLDPADEIARDGLRQIVVARRKP
jgi:hypothetical protein